MELIKTDKVLEICNVCYKTLKKWQEKEGFPRKLAGTNRYSVDDIKDWIDKKSNKNCQDKDKKNSDNEYLK